MNKPNMAIAKTILAQLGGNRFTVMTGAKDFLALDNGLRFRIPMKTKVGANVVVIRLTPEDLYDMSFLSVRGQSVKTKASVEGVYADQLATIFTDQTGLDTHL